MLTIIGQAASGGLSHQAMQKSSPGHPQARAAGRGRSRAPSGRRARPRRSAPRSPSSFVSPYKPDRRERPLQLAAHLPFLAEQQDLWMCDHALRPNSQRERPRSIGLRRSNSPHEPPERSPATAIRRKADDEGRRAGHRERGWFRSHGELAVVVEYGPGDVIGRVHAP